MERVDVAVIGAGMAGASAAWRLREAGREVAVLDRYPPGHVHGSSHGTTRIFRFAYPDPLYVRMARAAREGWRQLEAVSGRELLRTTGGVDAGPHARAVAAALEACGEVCERLPRAEAAARFPGLRLSGADAVWSPDSGVLAAAEALRAMLDGADVRLSAVTAVEPDDDAAMVRTVDGSLRARRCVLAAGAWTAPLAARAGITLPLRVTREQVLYFAGEDVPVLIHLDDGVVRYAVPRFADAPGVKVAEHGTGPETDPDARSFEVDPQGAARVREYVERTLPALEPRVVGAETCLYTTTPDEDFVLDRRGPLVVASPCSGHGFKFGPLIGQVLAALTMDREPTVDITRFAIARFA